MGEVSDSAAQRKAVHGEGWHKPLLVDGEISPSLQNLKVFLRVLTAREGVRVGILGLGSLLRRCLTALHARQRRVGRRLARSPTVLLLVHVGEIRVRLSIHLRLLV